MEFDSSSPIYLQIADSVKRLIISGKWQKGEKIPPVRELALQMGVNPNTMQRALALLEDEKLLRSERTSGRYVTTDEEIIGKARSDAIAAEIDRFFAAMRSIGYTDDEILPLVFYEKRKRDT